MRWVKRRVCSALLTSNQYLMIVIPESMNDFPGGREMLDIALEVDLRALPLSRRGQGDEPERARADGFDNAFEDAAFAGCIPALEEDNNPCAGMLDPVLHLDRLGTQLSHLCFILCSLELGLAVRRHAFRCGQTSSRLALFFLIWFHHRLDVLLLSLRLP